MLLNVFGKKYCDLHESDITSVTVIASLHGAVVRDTPCGDVSSLTARVSLDNIVRNMSVQIKVRFDSLRGTDSDRYHCSDVIMGAMASQITSPKIVYSTVYSGADQRKYQSYASLAFVRGIHRWPVNSPHKWLVARKTFPLDDVIMTFRVVNVFKAWPFLNDYCVKSLLFNSYNYRGIEPVLSSL